MNPFETTLLEVSLWITKLRMGSSLSPEMANIYMNLFKTTLLDGIPMDHQATYGFKLFQY